MQNKLVRSLAWALLFQSPTLMAGECKFQKAPDRTTLPNKWLYVWEQEYDPALYDATTPVDTPFLSRYWKEVAKYTSTDPIKLLERQRALFIKAFGENAGLSFTQLMEGRIGEIVPRRCFETILLEQHLSHQTKAAPQTEFIAVTLRKNKLMRVYQVVGTGPGGPQVPTEAIDAIKDGWVFENHLHNHFFALSRSPSVDIAGTVIPSGSTDGTSDIAEYLRWKSELGLRSAAVTNGFSTSLFDASEFDQFER